MRWSGSQGVEPRLLSGSDLKDPVSTDFCIGVAGYPEKHAEAPNFSIDIANLKKRSNPERTTSLRRCFSSTIIITGSCRHAERRGSRPDRAGDQAFSRLSDLELIPQTFHIDLPDALVDAVLHASSPARSGTSASGGAPNNRRISLHTECPASITILWEKAESVAKVVRAAF